MSAESGFERLQSAVEDVVEADEHRRTVVRQEVEAFEQGTEVSFPQTRRALEAERAALDELKDLLETEDARIDNLAEVSAFLSVDQAVRNRDEALSKLREHNELLWEFHDCMLQCVEGVAANLDALEAGEDSNLEHDPERDVEAAKEAIKEHNAAVEGLDTNLTILAAYLS